MGEAFLQCKGGGMAKIITVKTLSEQDLDKILRDILGKEKCFKIKFACVLDFHANDLKQALTSRGVSLEPEEFKRACKKIKKISLEVAQEIARDIICILGLPVTSS